ncbi:MAG: hypothetical protein NVS2B16_37350 [Chloroflexota bacterium]
MLINYVRHPDDAQHTADAVCALGVRAETPFVVKLSPLTYSRIRSTSSVTTP